MSLEEFKRQAQNHFTVTLSWDEARALQRLYGNPGERDGRKRRLWPIVSVNDNPKLVAHLSQGAW